MLSGARAATLAVFFCIAALEAFAFVDHGRAGVPDASLVADSQSSNDVYRVQSAGDGSPLHAGDRIKIPDPGDLMAMNYHTLAAGSTLHVLRLAPAPVTSVEVPVIASGGPALSVVLLIVEAMFLGIAALIAARGRAPGSMSLAWLFGLLVLLFDPMSPAWPHWLLEGYSIFGASVAIFALACAVDFTTRFTGDSQARWARRLRTTSRIAAVALSALNIAVSYLSLHEDSTAPALQYIGLAGLIFQPLLFLTGLVVAYVKAPAGDRQRAAWVVVSLGVGVVGFVFAVALSVAGTPEPLRDVPLLLLAFMPLGCAYSILRYRLLDIGFVVNRATVFGITSLLVLASLALVDYGLEAWLGSWLTRTGMYVQLGLALAIGIATRPLHEGVDRVVDDLFFRQRHEAERALRQFARDVAHIDDPGVLLQRTVDTVARAAELRCSIYLAGTDGWQRAAASSREAAPLELDRNDGAVVRLLATREPVDLHDVESALPGDFAFPMFARSRLSGVLVCDGKADGAAAYAPDEIDAIGSVAHAAGLALDLLRIESLERELDELRPKLLRTGFARGL
jgi:hypothetical protein